MPDVQTTNMTPQQRTVAPPRTPVQRTSKTAATRLTFPLQLAVSFKVLSPSATPATGVGETVSVSRNLLTFTTSGSASGATSGSAPGITLEPGQLVRVSMRWPAKLDNHVPLDLVVDGRILQCSESQASVWFDKYEFRTRKSELVRAAAAGERAA